MGAGVVCLICTTNEAPSQTDEACCVAPVAGWQQWLVTRLYVPIAIRVLLSPLDISLNHILGVKKERFWSKWHGTLAGDQCQPERPDDLAEITDAVGEPHASGARPVRPRCKGR
jgi:hypothetical protein